MAKRVLAGTAMAGALVIALLARSAFAITAAQQLPLTPAHANLVEHTAIFCRPLGGGPVWDGRRPWHWGPWDQVYRPACPIGYYYACRRGPLAYGRCACWPYREW